MSDDDFDLVHGGSSEAIERYLHDGRSCAAINTIRPAALRRTPQEAAMRMLERRKFHPLPDGMNIRDLMTYGRA